MAHSHSHAPPPSTSTLQNRAINLSLAVAVLMLVGKVGAAVMTGSDAIWSDAAESIIHIVATAVAAMSLRIAAMPPDKLHPYGRGKISYFSAGAEGMLIIIAALSIFYQATRSLILGPQVQNLGAGLLITAVLGAINLGLGLHLIHQGRKHRSIILVANGEHVMTDMWTSAAVLIGVAVVWATDLLWLDPIVAILAAANIVRSGGTLIKEAYHGLMEVADLDDTRAITELLEAEVQTGVVSAFHELKHRRIGDDLFVEVHLLVPDEITIAEAHRRASAAERRIAEHFAPSTVEVLSHIEPKSHDGHPDGHS